MAELVTWCRIMRVGPVCPRPCDECRLTSRKYALASGNPNDNEAYSDTNKAPKKGPNVGLNVTESTAVSNIVHHLTGTPAIQGMPVPTREQAIEALALLSGAAYKRLGAGLSRTGAQQLLEHKWAEDPAEPLPIHIDERNALIAVKVAHAAAKYGITTLTSDEFYTWMQILGLSDGIGPLDLDDLWDILRPAFQSPDVAVVLPALVKHDDTGGE